MYPRLEAQAGIFDCSPGPRCIRLFSTVAAENLSYAIF